MSDKTVDEILVFAKEQMDLAGLECRYEEHCAFHTIIDYIESHRSELTPEELAQMKEKITNTPVTRREVDEEEINGE